MRNLKSIGFALVASLSIGCGQKSSSNTEQTDVSSTSENQSSASSEATAFTDELTDRRLMKISNYNSGSGGEGMMSESYYDLCSGGGYRFHQSSSISIEGNTSESNSDDQGTWKVIDSENGPLLVLNSDQGQEVQCALSIENGTLYINNEKWYHIAKGEKYGPESCN